MKGWAPKLALRKRLKDIRKWPITSTPSKSIKPKCHTPESKNIPRGDSVRIELRRNVRIESNRKVPQTNRLTLGVLDMDDNIFSLTESAEQ